MARDSSNRLLEYVVVATSLCLATAAVTWPHAKHFTTSVVDHIDPLFSMWRLGWFAHAIARGEHLLDANIFFPEPATLLLSDAVFLESTLAAPALWSGVPLTTVYNTLLLLGIVSSGVAIYYVATALDVERAPAFLAAVLFALAPYRIEHIVHLELQWVAPGVLALASLHRMLYSPCPRHAVALALLVSAQFLACVYYAVFLLPLVAALALAAAPRLPRFRSTVAAGLLAAAVAAALTLPVAALYMAQGKRVGQRPPHQLVSFSATPENYLASPRENVLYGGTADWLGSGERRLFPGAVAIVFGCVGLFSGRRRLVIASLIVVIVAAALSLGVNGGPYRLLYSWWPVLHGLRAPARYGMFVLAGVAMLAALGMEHLFMKVRASPRRRRAILTVALLVAGVEYYSPQDKLLRTDGNPPVYSFLRYLPDGVVLELPFALEKGPDLDADYTFWSTRHWRKLLNGYSGYYPPSHEATRARLECFPDATAMALLEERKVRYVLLHTLYMPTGEVTRLTEALLGHPRFRWLGTHRDWAGPTHVFEIR